MDARTSELRLLADIGGTNARFALATQSGEFVHIKVLGCSDYATLSDAISAYLDMAGDSGAAVASIRHAAFAIANPVEGDLVSMTNHHWSFSINRLRDAHTLDSLLVVNDFAALAMALPHLQDDQKVRVGTAGVLIPNRPIGLIGPGTGLGVAAVIPVGQGRYIALPGEGGHASFAPCSKQESDILEFLRQEFGHVSAERLLSGMGLELIHRALTGQRMDAPDITNGALDGSCDDCVATVEQFCAILGSMAGNVALTLGATGGMFIGGGIVPRLGNLFTESSFRERFEGKGRLSPYLQRIPTWLITEQYPALSGVAAMLADHIAVQ
jgi:glucokinase